MPKNAGRPPAIQSLAALSHEFRTPLNGVLGMARLLEGTRLTAEQRAYLDALKQSGDHLLSLVNDVLDIAKLDAGKLVLEPVHVSPADLLQSTAELLSPRAHAKGIEIAWAAPSYIPTILADGGRLRQVLFNLAGNAVKFTEAGGVLLSVAQTGGEDGAVQLRFTVVDTGPGVPKSEHKRIFEAFAQVDPSHSARRDSTGLGLAIVNRLAQAHGGSVGLDSTAGHGASFWFEAAFPVVEEHDEDPPLLGQTVVVAAANPVLRRAATRQVIALGGRAIPCESLEEAAKHAPEGSAVLADHGLARKGRPLKPIPGRPTLIMLTPEQRSRLSRYKAAGFAGYLIKPLRQASLAERVYAVLSESPAEAPQRKDERAAAEPAKGARILLVEDNAINALLARKLLEREGCSVDWAMTGEEAIEAAGKARYDLILMDRRLPKMDGLAATARLRGEGVTAPICALTADAFEEDRRLCLAAGMDDFLVKPLEPVSLRAVLTRALRGGWTKPSTDAKLAS